MLETMVVIIPGLNILVQVQGLNTNVKLNLIKFVISTEGKNLIF